MKKLFVVILIVAALIATGFFWIKSSIRQVNTPDVRTYPTEAFCERVGLTPRESKTIKFHYINLDDDFYVFSLPSEFAIKPIKEEGKFLARYSDRNARTIYYYSGHYFGPSSENEIRRQLAITAQKLENL